MEIKSNGGWLWIGDLKNISDISKTITGKYLVFSSNREILVEVAQKEINYHGFQIAKVSEKSEGDYVLCIY